MQGCLRSAGGLEDALDFSKGRMLAEDDPFEVVCNPARDPGADKRGLLRSGEVPSNRGDTGGACLPSLWNRFREGAGIGAAQLT